MLGKPLKLSLLLNVYIYSHKTDEIYTKFNFCRNETIH